MAMAAAVPQKTKTAARHSSSFQPPKSAAVAAEPRISAAVSEVRSSVRNRAGRPGGTILARAKATAADATQSATPTDRRLARDSQEPGTQEIAAMMTETSHSRNNHHHNHKILAIEDDPEVLALYKSYLQRRGYQVLSAAGAVEGISILQSNPDTRLILLDLNRPGMSGEEWIAWYLQQGKQTPVVVASGKGDILTITKGNNMTAALTKPFHMEELQELIEVLLADDWHDQVSVDKKTH